MNPKALSVLALLIAMASVQSGAAYAHELFPALGAAGTATLRVLFAAMMLWSVWHPWRRTITGADLALIFAYGAALGFMNLLFYTALTKIPLGVAVALEFTGPLLVALIGSKHPLHLLWAALAAIGIALILPLHSSSEASLDTLGVALALAAGVAWAAYILIGSKVGKRFGTGHASALGMAFAALVVLPFGIANAGTALLDSRLLPLALMVAFMSSALPYTLEMFALKRLPARSFGILMSLEPACGAIAGAVILHESLTPTQVVAIAFVMAASLGTTVIRTPQATSSTQVELH